VNTTVTHLNAGIRRHSLDALNNSHIFHPILNNTDSLAYRVGQKSKLLIFSEYVNKTEKTGGT